jgi:hypothetical protein
VASYLLACLDLSCYPGVMFTEIDSIERELLARMRVLECITPRMRAAEVGLCACVEWRAADLGLARWRLRGCSARDRLGAVKLV